MKTARNNRSILFYVHYKAVVNVIPEQFRYHSFLVVATIPFPHLTKETISP